MTPASLDLSLFTGGNISQHQDFASKLLNSLSQHGFVKIVGHGVPKAMVVELFAWVSNTGILSRTLKHPDI